MSSIIKKRPAIPSSLNNKEIFLRDCAEKTSLPGPKLRSNTYILLTKHEGRTGRISTRGLDSKDRAQRGPYKKDQGPIFSQDGREQAWLIRDLSHD